ncbi:hypothetical protein K437DRAFT_63066 [Tilletiaria anomala UBC 951]|uniref:Uncharacterized protein n=1 Tax=Tilletiaria anomala (strain ATCC 24038 / CBS 436.72 / UBC 951) TaxID=1037660 RepID=A0A066VBX4_TILAU|nr:uncharacterized protein K437DRAFT_63066 [Tilletiaria anomala UBC 951]KDN36095.1 hypothetical protein K437DRAFT_63066 [Tilletiaria anomala UBC 951]
MISALRNRHHPVLSSSSPPTTTIPLSSPTSRNTQRRWRHPAEKSSRWSVAPEETGPCGSSAGLWQQSWNPASWEACCSSQRSVQAPGSCVCEEDDQLQQALLVNQDQQQSWWRQQQRQRQQQHEKLPPKLLLAASTRTAPGLLALGRSQESRHTLYTRAAGDKRSRRARRRRPPIDGTFFGICGYRSLPPILLVRM